MPEKTLICPGCNVVVPAGTEKCPDCGLDFTKAYAGLECLYHHAVEKPAGSPSAQTGKKMRNTQRAETLKKHLDYVKTIIAA